MDFPRAQATINNLIHNFPQKVQESFIQTINNLYNYIPINYQTQNAIKYTEAFYMWKIGIIQTNLYTPIYLEFMPDTLLWEFYLKKAAKEHYY